MSNETVTTPAGLLTLERTPVPLIGVSVDAEISTFCARVTVSHRYVNREATPIEAVYVFPLDEGAAVCGFEAIIDGTLVVGEVKEREEAFRMYDDALEAGHGGFLLDEERPDVFQASIGNLLPGKEVLLKLVYVTELPVEGTGLRFSIPTTVSPRYAPAADCVGVGRPDAEALNPPVGWHVPYGLNLTARLAMAGRITRLESPSHPVAVELNGNTGTVTLSQHDAALDCDLVLSVEAGGLDTPAAWLEGSEDGAASVAIGFVPRLPEVTTPSEIIFVVDRSGSMHGTSIQEVRNALQLCLRSMTSACRFNIVGFGSTFAAVFPESRPYDDARLAEASAHVMALQADLGGTEILPALQFALGLPGHAGLSRQLVVMTDGEVTNTDAVLALARQHSSHARIFTFGIGAGASHHLVKGLARAGGGMAEFIYPGERIEPKVVRQFGRLLSPALTNVRVHWGGLDVAQAPSTVPPVFSGGRVLVYGFLKSPAHTVAQTTVRLSADTPSGPLAFDVPVDPTCAVAGHAVAILTARARIRELEEGVDWISGRGSRQRERKSSLASQEIVALAVRHGLMSRETSYVAIERRERPVHGDMQLRRVPIALTTGWGGLEASARRAMGVAQMWLSAPAMPMSTVSLAHDESLGGLFGMQANSFGRARYLVDSVGQEPARLHRSVPPGKTDAVGPVPPQMHALVTLQRADGTWDLTREFAALLGVDFERLELAIAGAAGDSDDIRRAWATALALAWLRTHARQVEEEWRLLATKARKWIDDVTAVPPGRGAWVEAAGEFLRSSVEKDGQGRRPPFSRLL